MMAFKVKPKLVLGWYSAFTLTVTMLLGSYGFLITKETPAHAMLALLILYLPPAVYIWITLLNKK